MHAGMRVRVLFLANCFDGAASAALFTAFYRERIDASAEFAYTGMHHTMGDPFPPGCMDGAENVCVDFRYNASPKLTWWFDHHVSAFMSPADEATFHTRPKDRFFFDPQSRSCTKFLVERAATVHGWDASRFEELVYWADIIDGAQFPSAQAAVEMAEPALRLMTWIENNKDPALAERYIADLLRLPLAEIVALPYIAEPVARLLASNQGAVDIWRKRAKAQDGVVFADVSEDAVESANKFIPYFLHPECRYAVSVSKTATRSKVSIGSNPWSDIPRSVNIAQICERYGGGGHPVVGAVSLGGGDIVRAREIAGEVVEELRRAALAEVAAARPRGG